MHCKALVVLAASLIGSALASPIEATVIATREAVAAPISLPIDRRASNEGVYLVNCDGDATWSEMAYYSNAKQHSQNGQTPDATSIIDDSGFITWEGQEICGFFQDSGETFCSNISSTGSSQSTGTQVGTGFNNQTNFNCFKDNGRQLYAGNGFHCNSIYYCFDA